MTDTLLAATVHAAPAVVDAGHWCLPDTAAADMPPIDSLVPVAAIAGRALPRTVDSALANFVDEPNRAGALLLRNVPIGSLPPTPITPTTPVDKNLATELALLTIARRLGQPVGYVLEHGGRIVQNIVPTRSDADAQTSTSSRSNLMFHTETAFHPYRPHYLLLLCLRGDAAAHTTLVSVHELMARLPETTVEIMFEPRFRTAVDSSFLDGRTNVSGEPRPLVTGTRAEPTFVFDADLTSGTDNAAGQVVRQLCALIDSIKISVILESGDLLVVDNNLAVHGRSPFVAEFDGADRWLQRSFVVADLAPSAAERRGRVITTEFGRP